MIYSFDQNNSGGSYARPAKHIIVKDARDESHAIEIALKAGMYLDGVADGLDCGCCGDRWYGMAKEFDHIDQAISDAVMGYDDGGGIPQYVIVDDLDISSFWNRG